jgi:adenylate cyclase
MMSNGIVGRLSIVAPRDGEAEAVEVIVPEALRTQLQRIITSQEFDASDRNRRFLQYVVEETLVGRTERIKAYNVATSVFGRDASFDPQTDPIIRIEASRLRRSLERYYLTAGKHDPVRIEIPKGTYVPTFRTDADKPPVSDVSVPELSDTTPAVSSSAAKIEVDGNGWRRRIAAAAGLLAVLVLAWLGVSWTGHYPPFSTQRQAAAVTERVPAIFVAPFDNDGGNASDDGLTRGFTREVIIGLARTDGLFVYGPEGSFLHGTGADPSRVHDLQVDFVLTGGVSVSENQFRVAALLIDARTGRILWSNIFERDITGGNVFDARESIANQIALAVAQPNGVFLGAQKKSVRTEATVRASFMTTRH